METIVIVPRYVREWGSIAGHLELFLPYSLARRGYIEVWHPDDGHNEASLDFYHGTQAPWACQRAAEALVEQYKAWIQHVLRDIPHEVRVRQRLPNDWREHAWRST